MVTGVGGGATVSVAVAVAVAVLISVSVVGGGKVVGRNSVCVDVVQIDVLLLLLLGGR